jgi:hypothetical protein
VDLVAYRIAELCPWIVLLLCLLCSKRTRGSEEPDEFLGTEETRVHGGLRLIGGRVYAIDVWMRYVGCLNAAVHVRSRQSRSKDWLRVL